MRNLFLQGSQVSIMSTQRSPPSAVFPSTDVRLCHEERQKQEQEHLVKMNVTWPSLSTPITPSRNDDTKRKAVESPEDSPAPARLWLGSSPKLGRYRCVNPSSQAIQMDELFDMVTDVLSQETIDVTKNVTIVKKNLPMTNKVTSAVGTEKEDNVIIAKEHISMTDEVTSEVGTEKEENESVHSAENPAKEPASPVTSNEQDDFVSTNKTTISIELMNEAIIKAIQPLKDEIKSLSEFIRANLKNVSKNDVPHLSLQEIQSPDSLGARRGWGLAGQGRKKILKPMNYAETAAAAMNPRKEGLNLDAPPKPKPPIKAKQSRPDSNPAFALARRCLGFNPISSKDLEKYDHCYPEITDKEERFQRVGKDCVRDFLHYDMDVTERVAADIRIKSVFFATSGLASAILYAEFHSEGEATIVKQHTKNLSTINGRRSRVIPYIPKSLFKRFKAVEEVAFNIRVNNRSMATRIWITNDFELRVRKKGDSTQWSLITPETLPNLPEQDEKSEKFVTDLMDKRRPITPKTFDAPQITFSRFDSENLYNLLGEEEAN